MITADQLKDIKERTDALKQYLAIDEKIIQVEEEQLRTQAPGFWDNAKEAEAQMKKVKGLQAWIDGYKEVKNRTEEAEMAMELYREEMVEEHEVDDAYARALTAVEELELKNMLRGEADDMDCVLKINSGAGGTEAQDWASMLMRMYMRWAEANGYKVTVANLQEAEDAGIKTVTLELKGPYAYGYLKGENGVHRLVRVSPFDSNARRQTSFAAIEVIPDIVDDSNDVEIKAEDYEMQVFRSSGAGGQHINKTSSAVRLIHKATGIVVACQTERSQFQNKENCLRMLRSKLVEIKEREHLEKISDIKGVQQKIEWGSQIRSYVFMPYTLAKDTRTAYEMTNINAVMDGDIDGFINAYLTCAATGTWATK